MVGWKKACVCVSDVMFLPLCACVWPINHQLPVGRSAGHPLERKIFASPISAAYTKDAVLCSAFLQTESSEQQTCEDQFRSAVTALDRRSPCHRHVTTPLLSFPFVSVLRPQAMLPLGWSVGCPVNGLGPKENQHGATIPKAQFVTQGFFSSQIHIGTGLFRLNSRRNSCVPSGPLVARRWQIWPESNHTETRLCSISFHQLLLILPLQYLVASSCWFLRASTI